MISYRVFSLLTLSSLAFGSGTFRVAGGDEKVRIRIVLPVRAPCDDPDCDICPLNPTVTVTTSISHVGTPPQLIPGHGVVGLVVAAVDGAAVATSSGPECIFFNTSLLGEPGFCVAREEHCVPLLYGCGVLLQSMVRGLKHCHIANLVNVRPDLDVTGTNATPTTVSVVGVLNRQVWMTAVGETTCPVPPAAATPGVVKIKCGDSELKVEFSCQACNQPQ